jgi:hypothetical protein
VTRALWEEDDGSQGKMNIGIAIFFSSFFLLVGIVLMNVVIACLLDKFITTMSEEKEEAGRQQREEKDRQSSSSGPFDPLMKVLMTYTSQEDLDVKLNEICGAFDNSSDDRVTHRHVNEALRHHKHLPPIYISPG